MASAEQLQPTRPHPSAASVRVSLAAVLSGTAAGAGKQTRGCLINLTAHWGVALPSALLLGFHFKLGVEGLYTGVILGPCTQFCFFLALILRLNWEQEARIAHARMMEARSDASTDCASL